MFTQQEWRISSFILLDVVVVDLAGWEQGWEKFLKGMSWENWYSLSLWPFLIYPFVPYLSYLTFMTLTGASHLHVGSCVDIALSVVARSCVTDGFDSLSHIPWESPSRKGMSSTCFPRAVCPCALHAVSLTLFHSWVGSLIRYCLFRSSSRTEDKIHRTLMVLVKRSHWQTQGKIL